MNYGSMAWYYVNCLLGRKRPLLAGMKLTHACNLSCRHCPFWRRDPVTLPFNRAVAAMDVLSAWGVRALIFEGGEPFLWRDGDDTLADLVAEARRRYHCVGITTNGTFPIEVPADIVWVSIDGMKATHDRIRGESFDQAMSNISRSAHPRIFAHITINTLNRAEISELVAFLAARVKGITVQFHYPYGEIDEALFLPVEQRRETLDELIRLKRRGFPIMNSVACLRALQGNRWRCRPWMIASADPNGQLTHGCYLENRGEIACERCGFSAHTELSLAYGCRPGAILAGMRIFRRRAGKPSECENLRSAAV